MGLFNENDRKIWPIRFGRSRSVYFQTAFRHCTVNIHKNLATKALFVTDKAIYPLTLPAVRSIFAIMNYENNPAKAESDLNNLEKQVDQLIKICDELKGENHLLRERQSSLVEERASLIEKTELARVRVEAMIDRLKSLESD